MRMLLILLVGLGMLLPRTGAVLAELAGFDIVVICRGAELMTITITSDGEPVETEIEDHGPCLAAAAPIDTARPAPAWHRLAADHALTLPPRIVLTSAAPWRGPPPERGPPSA